MTAWLLVMLLVWPVSAFAHDDLIGAEFVACYDGDTCTVNLKGLPSVFGHHLPIRLRGIDTPEINGECIKESEQARAVRARLQQILGRAKTINLKEPTRDKYFRIDAIVIADGVNLNQLLIRAGLARPYDGGKRQSWCDGQ